MVIGTAGHVDHGKTALVKALTGVDTDRLPEEKAREITIELGFAPLQLPDGTTCSVVDVPGHERFIKNMLAGATGVDVVLLCVDAREGVQPQTREHLDILGLVGARVGVAALTKVDTIPATEVGPAAATLSAYLAGTALAGCPVVPVSAKTGEGLDRLIARLAAAVTGVVRPAGARSGPARLAIDRAFNITGFGTVVTGTVASGRIGLGQRLQVYPEGPVLRARRMEVHGLAVPDVGAGERVALNLAGDLGNLGEVSLRGSVLAEPGTLEPATVAGLLLRILPGFGPLEDLQRVRFHAGTSETLGRVILLDGRRKLEAAPDPPAPGDGPSGEVTAGAVPVVFEAERPLALARGQEFVIRSYSPPRTIGGGVALAPSLDRVVGDRPRSRAAREAAAVALSRPPGSAERPPVPGGFAPLTRYLRLLGPDLGAAAGSRTTKSSGTMKGSITTQGPGTLQGPGTVQSPGTLQGSGTTQGTGITQGTGTADGSAGPATGRPLPPGVKLLAGGQYVAEEEFYASVGREVRALLRQQHEAKPHLASVGREVVWSWLEGRGLAPALWLETLASDGLIILTEGRIKLTDWAPKRPPPLQAAAEKLSRAFLDGGLAPPAFEPAATGLSPDLAAAALELLILEGGLICLAGVPGALAGDPVFHPEVVAAARRRLEEHLDRYGEVTVAGFRDLVGSTRKYVLPLLEYFDRARVTLRRGDLRVRHPTNRPAPVPEEPLAPVPEGRPA